ncbi:DHCW motif cupin fold protein [Consotaella aegiceratis]|uniref:DHCW motif cupin fold protein n=1 Tax=Consotaella aegiceratis TaxID=3097961 RepID=UPI002F401228
MKLSGFPLTVVDWETVEPTRHEGEVGHALWRTQYFGEGEARIRVRIVEYSPGYVADHWCVKGHVIYCLEGELETHLKDGSVFRLKPGMSYQVADDAEAHASRTATGVKLFIVD